MSGATHRTVMSPSKPQSPNDRELEAIDRKIRSIIFEDRENGVSWDITSRKVAGLIADARIGWAVVSQRGSLSSLTRQTCEDVAVELEHLVFERIITNDFSVQFDPDRILNGESACGWARMFMGSAMHRVVNRHVSHNVRTALVDQFEEGSSTRFVHQRRTDRSAADEDARAAEATQMIATMSHGLADEERQGVVVAGIGWYLGLPYAWPQVAEVREWARKHVDGPRSAVMAIEAVLEARSRGVDHPFSAMFDGWSDEELTELIFSHALMAFGWITGAATARPGPTRKATKRLADRLLGSEVSGEWAKLVRAFAADLASAMAGADREFGARQVVVRSDEELAVAAADLAASTAALAAFPGSPLGDEPSEIIRSAISMLIADAYDLAVANEDLRLAAS